VIHGYAGTGKTTIARHLAEGCRNPLFCAYTGKAASVLRRTGIAASTIHSLLYKPMTPDPTRLIERRADLAKAERDGAAAYVLDSLRAEVEHLTAEQKRPRFALNEESAIKQADLVVMDESSMITKQIRDDAARFGVKLLILGDPGQLPPVRGEGYYGARPADARLTEIRRQALDNPILRYATMAREGETIPFGKDGAFAKVPRAKVTDASIVAAVAKGAQLLAGYNVTRRELNALVRAANGLAGVVYPMKGERVVILKNNHELGVFNGVTADVLATVEPGEDEGAGLYLTLQYEDRVLEFVPVEWELFDALAAGKDFTPGFSRTLVPVDFGSCLTVHKAQGSQWDHVIVFDDGFGKRDAVRAPATRKQWLYTAITRAAERCTIVA